MKTSFIFLLLLISLNTPAQQPNIILFLVDDMGWQDCSVPFWTRETEWNKKYRTPNMEQLADEGMKFTNAYATPVCSPSRVSLMTGMNAARHRVTNWTLRKDKSTDHIDSVLQSPRWNVNGMSPVPGVSHTIYATPLPSLLKEAGYYTIHCGKAHFGAMSTPAADPTAIGFIKNIAGHAAGGPGSYLSEKYFGNTKDKLVEPWGVPGLEQYYDTDTFLTEALTIEAIKALKKPVKEKKPFFLYMSHYAIHIPYAADKRFIQKYLDMKMPPVEAEYAALIEGMDKSLGDLMKFLKEEKIDKNTIIIFMSDNGGYSMPPRAGESFSQNHPLRAGKGSVYEGGIREPMLVKWPGVVKPGTTAEQYVIIEDFFPTVLEMAGVKNHKTVQPIDGISFLPLLKNRKQNETSRPLIWHFPHKWIQEDGPGINYHSAIRQGNWKLVYNIKTQTKELYNLKTDIGEKTNLANQYPERVEQLSLLLSKKLTDWNAQMPTLKSNNQLIPLPDQIK